MADSCGCFVHCCRNLHGVPAALICVLVFVIQSAVMDYYLIEHLSIAHFFWIGADMVNFIILIVCIHRSRSSLAESSNLNTSNKYSFAWISWLTMSIALASKMIIIFSKFAAHLYEPDPSIFGPNILKTTIALSACKFLLLLTTQHQAPLGSDNRRYIEELTGTVVFDLLDTVDILEILFDAETGNLLWDGLKECILAVATLNLLLPTIPFLILSTTRYGFQKLQKRFIYLHRLLLVLAVNVPNLLVRMILWHMFSVTVSPFTLKNVLLIFMTFYEFYEHRKQRLEELESELIARVTHRHCHNGNRSDLAEAQSHHKQNGEYSVSGNAVGNERNSVKSDDETKNPTSLTHMDGDTGDEPEFPLEERIVTSV